MNATDSAHAARLAAGPLARTRPTARNAALAAMASALQDHRDEIFTANGKDLRSARETGLAAPLLARLSLDEKKLQGLIDGLDTLRALPDPLGVVQVRRELAPGLVLERVTCPIGVIGVVFESRPDALVQIASLCLKSGNACLLKGGREALETNRALYGILAAATTQAGMPDGWMQLLESRQDVDEILSLDREIDLLVPRGSNAFVRSISERTRIPVMGHAAGICHLYLDASADPGMAAAIAVDAKTQAPATCNSIETLLVHTAAAPAILPPVATALRAAGVRLLGDETARRILPDMEPASAEDWDAEYLAPVLSVKIVSSLQEAVAFINEHGSRHTDAIIAQDRAAADEFIASVDSADVFWNCSTRFADGFRFGLGAELGIATGKLHARGPVGPEGLATYKWVLRGSGQTVAPFAEGAEHFTHKNLPLPQNAT